MKRVPAALVACLTLAWVPARASAGASQVLTRHFTSADQQSGRYQYVPFDVAPGTTRIAIAYRYDRAGGANVIDLGLFEPGPLSLRSRAFRGWSGGEHDIISVAVDQATPGYWPGPLPPGRWHVLLGLYKVGGTGVDVELTVTTTDEAVGPAPSLAQRAAPPSRRASDAPTGRAWYAGVLHAHTTYSDGALSPQQLAEKAAGERLDFLAITDHNNTAHQVAPIDVPNLLVIVGEEITTPGGHFNVWGLGGLRDDLDFRVLPGDPAIASIMRAAQARGALVSINHPIADCVACSWTHDVPGDVNAIEIANGTREARLQAMTMWDLLLRAGRQVTAVGESDWHRGTAPLGVPSVRVWAEALSAPAILDAIRQGRVVVMADGATPPPTLIVRTRQGDARVGDRIRVAGDETLRIEVDGADAAYTGGRVELYWSGEPVARTAIPENGHVVFERVASTRGYLRVHVFRADGSPLAITNPVFVEVAAR